MSSRTVAVVLKAQVDDYVAQMGRAQKHTTDVEKAARSATEQFRKHNEALTAVGVGMAGVGAAAAVALGAAIKAASDYGAKMAQLQSLSHAGAQDMQRLSQAAMSAGSAYGYTATQVAEAEIELSKAGRSASDMLNGDLKGALALAAAGQMDVAKATEIGVTALTQFRATGATIPQVADALAAGADKALGSVQDLGMALQQGGLVASQMGLTLDDTVGTLSAFAQAGLMGSDAGTSLKNMFLMLQSPTKQSKDLLDQYNITAYNTQGQFVGVANLAGQLQRAFKDKSDAERDAALSTIFGSDAIRAANVLYTQGQDGIRGWIKAVDDTGFASAQAAGKLNSLQGDAQKLSAAFENNLIKAGSSVDGMFRNVVQSATGLTEFLGSVPQPVMAVGVGLTGLVAAVGLVGGTALIAVPKIVAFRATLDELGISGRKTAGYIGKGSALLVGIGLLGAGIAATAQKGVADAQQIAEAGRSITKGWKDVDKLFAGDGGFQQTGGLMQALNGERYNAGAAKILDTWSAGLTHFSDLYKTNEGTFDALGQQLAGLAQQDYGRASSSFAELSAKYKLGADDQKRLLDQMPAYRDELVKQAQAADVSTSGQGLLNLALGKGADAAKVIAKQQEIAAHSAAEQQAGISELAGTAVSATTDIDKLSDAITGFGSTTLDARSAQRDFQQAVDDAREAAGKSGNALKDSTKADRDKQEALDAVAERANAVAGAFLKQPGGVAKAEASLSSSRKTFVKIAEDMGIGSQKAQDLADDLIALPDDVDVAVRLSGTDEAAEKAREFVNGLPRYFYLDPKIRDGSVTPGPTGPLKSGGTKADGTPYAAGGGVYGSGPKGVDSVRAILAPGEHVFTAAEVDRMGGQAAVSMFRADLMAGVQAFAKGGAVNAITQQQNAADQADADAKRYAREVRAARRAATAAEKAYDAIDGDKAHRDAKKAAKARQDAADDRVKDLEKKLEAARTKRSDATDAAAALRNDREDFVSNERRNPDQVTDDPLQYVDALRSASRDDNYSAARRKSFKDAANQYEKSLVDLGKRAEEASKTLDDLRSASKQMHDQVQQAITGGYSLSGAVTAAGMQTSTSDWYQQDGIAFQHSTQGGAVTAASIANYYAVGATHSDEFATALQSLAGRGLSTQLLAEIAQMGTEEGLPVARAILAGSDGEVASINQAYGALQAQGGRAGTIVADANYAQQIADADRHLQEINTTITEDGKALRRLLAQAFGLKGYATGTIAATEGLHWVGENGPEIVGLRAGTPVATAADSARWVRGAGAPAAPPQPLVVQAPPVNFPDTFILRDASGLELRMRVVAQQVVDEDSAQDAVMMMGGAA